MERTLSVPGRYDRLEQICRFVDEAAVAAGLSESESSRCQLAVDEACTNIIEHGYGGENRGEITVTCATQPGELTITIRDRARPFDPNEIPEPQLNTNLDDLRVGGLGLFFMRQVMDAVEFSYDGKGNVLVLVKRKDNGS
jgi:anti-sigma regulatory factor (Ser/Thr protein kinase)